MTEVPSARMMHEKCMKNAWLCIYKTILADGQNKQARPTSSVHDQQAGTSVSHVGPKTWLF